MAVNDESRMLITRAGLEQLERELDRLKNDERRRLADLLRDARGDGALDDNPTLIDLLDERTRLEARIATLEAQFAVAEIAPRPQGDEVGIGSHVSVRDSASGEILDYELVGPLEADVLNGRVSSVAPVGRALIGKRRGAHVKVTTPRGTLALELVRVTDPSLSREAA